MEEFARKEVKVRSVTAEGTLALLIAPWILTNVLSTTVGVTLTLPHAPTRTDRAIALVISDSRARESVPQAASTSTNA